jgi:hypothetical protein
MIKKTSLKAAKSPKPAAKPKAKAAKVAKAADAPEAAKAADTKPVKAKPGTIKILAKANPYKDGSDGSRYFAAMQKHAKLADYLDAFPDDKRKARQWLWNAINRGGHVALGGSDVE